jgi:hypothetical protein
MLLTGWQIIGPHPAITAWAQAALPAAQAAIAADPAGWRCGGTWHAGVDILPNGPDGAVGGVAFPWAALPLDPMALHPGQVSVIRKGYPQPWEGETAGAFAYRQTRDAAHLDGVLPMGAERRRMVKEPHAWILGLPLTDSAQSPLVVWEGSHIIIRDALLVALHGHEPATWGDVDITEAYHAARRTIFATCRRVELPAAPGQATLIHRLCLHGMAPWEQGEGDRMIAYFRPMLGSVREWLTA